MKKLFSLFALLAIMSFVVVSCSKNDNPADNDLFVGTYKGSVGYKNGDNNISTSEGSVMVTKVGDRYDFKFSDNIPAITNVKIDKGDEGYIGTVNGYTGLIKFNAKNLNILVTKDGATWSANANR